MNPLVSAEFENNRKAVDEGSTIESEKIKENITGIESPAINENSSIPAKNDIKEVVNPTVSEPGGYIVITGSFKSKENADSQINMLKEEGFSPEIVTLDNGFYRVCAIMCNDLSTAVNKKDSIAKKFPGVWISRKI